MQSASCVWNLVDMSATGVPAPRPCPCRAMFSKSRGRRGNLDLTIVESYTT